MHVDYRRRTVPFKTYPNEERFFVSNHEYGARTGREEGKQR
jgi:hypothetical protein